MGEEGPSCAGLTSGISKITHGRAHRVLDGLISVAGPDGTAAEGIVAVATQEPAVRPDRPEQQGAAGSGAARRCAGRRADPTGSTIGVSRRGSWWPIAWTGNADYDWTADHKQLQPDQFPDANPNGLTVRGRTVYVADAGANLLAKVTGKGHVSSLAYFQVPPQSPTDGVPTCVAKAGDGSLYVGELLGGTATTGQARVWQVWPNGKAKVKWTGFTGIQGCGFDDRGNFYVTEFQAHGMFGPDPAGDVVGIKPDGTRTTFGAGSLFFASGFAYRDGSVYVSNWSIMPGRNPGGHAGEVVKIDVRPWRG